MQITTPEDEEIDTTEIELAVDELQAFISEKSKQRTIYAYAIAILLMADAIADENAPLMH